MATKYVVCAVAAAIAAGNPAQSTLTENEMKAKTVQLTHGDSSDWSIALPAGAGEVEQFAGAELRKYIGLMSGADLAADHSPRHREDDPCWRSEGPEDSRSRCLTRRRASTGTRSP